MFDENEKNSLNNSEQENKSSDSHSEQNLYQGQEQSNQNLYQSREQENQNPYRSQEQNGWNIDQDQTNRNSYQNQEQINQSRYQGQEQSGQNSNNYFGNNSFSDNRYEYGKGQDQYNPESYRNEFISDSSQSGTNQNQNLNSNQSQRDSQNRNNYNFWEDQISATQSTNSNYNNIGTGTNYENNYQNDGGYRPNFQIVDKKEEEPQNVKEPKKRSMGGKIFRLIGSAAVFGLVAGAAFQGVGFVSNKLNPPKDQYVIGGNAIGNETQQSQQKIETTSVTPSATGNQYFADVSDVVEGAMPSIVSITSTVTQNYRDFFGNQFNKDSEGSGSGIIIGKNDDELLIVTNNHVVESKKTIAVKFIDEKIVEAEIKGTDSAADLAVISIELADIDKDTLEAIKIATLGDSESVKVGELAIAIGNAMGYGQSVTVGYVSAKDREVQLTDKTMVLLQTDAAINPGNSGGALLNSKGEVIGINSVKFASNEVEGMGYAIPISKATPIIDE